MKRSRQPCPECGKSICASIQPSGSLKPVRHLCKQGNEYGYASPLATAELERRVAIAKSMLEFYRCPYDGRLITANKGDDKAICDCKMAGGRGGTHYVRGLVSGDAQEYVLKVEAERMKLRKGRS